MKEYLAFDTVEEANIFFDNSPEVLQYYREDEVISQITGRIVWKKRARRVE